MSESRPNGFEPGPDDDRDGERHHFGLPRPEHFPVGVHRFRQLLADLIARRIREQKRKPPDVGESGNR